MKPRAAVFYFHDIVAANALATIPASHRPYALSLDDFRAYALAAAQLPRRSIPVSHAPGELGGGFYCLTFDDGCASDYTAAFPVLQELGLRATFFIVPTYVGTAGYVTWPQLREMVAAGMEVGSHSLTHPFVDRLDAAALRREFGDSKAVIEERLGLAVHSASLPRGWEPPAMREILGELGYRVFCTSRVGWWHPGDDGLTMPRIAVRQGMPIDAFAAIANAERRALWMPQAIEVAKNAVKACIGRGGWARLRSPLLRLRYAGQEEP
jgi:peptidoglycan/xylan/chitin deacetylase (PgdA/CDA1 family)